MASTDAIIERQVANAEKWASTADNKLALAIQLALSDREFDWPTPDDFEVERAYTSHGLVDKVDEFTDSYVPPTNFAEYDGSKDIYIPDLPVFPDDPDLDIDELFDQTAPDYEVDQFKKDVPDTDLDSLIDDLNQVDRPDINIGAAPTISDITVPPLPDVRIPEYDPQYTVPIIGDPSDYAKRFKDEYEQAIPEMRALIDYVMNSWISAYAPEYHTGLARLEAKIATDIEGGRGLSDEFERDLYNRARTRVENERIRNEQQLLSGMTKRGFTLPAGAVSAGLQAVHQSASDAIAQQATEIAIERAKMEMQHVQFVMGLSQTLRQMLIGAAIQYAQLIATINGQAIEFSKGIATLAKETYQLLIERAKLYVDLQRIEMEIFETQMKAALAHIEIYKIEMEALKLQVDVEEVRVQAYAGLIKAEALKVDIYKTEIDAAAKRAEVEIMRLDAFKAEAEAFKLKLQTKELEYRIYEAALKGDSAKLEGELGRLEVYTKQVQAEEIKQKAGLARTEADISVNRNLLEVFKSELDAYKVDVQAESTRYQASAEAYKTNLQTYIQKVGLEYEEKRIELEKTRLGLEIWAKNYEADLQKVQGEFDEFIKRTEIESGVTKSAADTYQSMASATLSSHNTMVSQVESGEL